MTLKRREQTSVPCSRKSGVQMRITLDEIDSVIAAFAQAKTALIVGGSPEAPRTEDLIRAAQHADVVIACDSGANVCTRADFAPDLLIGDEDSLSSQALSFIRSQEVPELIYPMDKDNVDLALAVSTLRQNCPLLERITFTGISGARPDHALAALGICVRASDLDIRIEERDFIAYILNANGARQSIAFDNDIYLGKTMSVIAPAGSACVDEWGMRWSVQNLALKQLGDQGISNVIESLPAGVRVHEGIALVTLLKQPIEKHVTQADV